MWRIQCFAWYIPNHLWLKSISPTNHRSNLASNDLKYHSKTGQIGVGQIQMKYPCPFIVLRLAPKNCGDWKPMSLWTPRALEPSWPATHLVQSNTSCRHRAIPMVDGWKTCCLCTSQLLLVSCVNAHFHWFSQDSCGLHSQSSLSPWLNCSNLKNGCITAQMAKVAP